MRDLQAYTKAAPTDAQVKKDLEFCMTKFMEQRKKKQEEAKNKPKIEEIEKEPAFKKVEIAEGSDTDSDDAEELKQKQAA